MSYQDKIQREILPIPDILHVGLTNCYANVMVTKFGLTTPDWLFFWSFALGGILVPHQVSVDWSDRYKGKFYLGRENLRGETFKYRKLLSFI